MRPGERFKAQLRQKITAGTDIIWISMAGDEGRCERSIASVCNNVEVYRVERTAEDVVTVRGTSGDTHELPYAAGESSEIAGKLRLTWPTDKVPVGSSWLVAISINEFRQSDDEPEFIVETTPISDDIPQLAASLVDDYSPPEFGKDVRLELLMWDCQAGASWDPELKDPTAMLDSLENLNVARGLIIVRDIHLLLNAQANWRLRRSLLNLAKYSKLSNRSRMTPLVILADSPTPHPAIKDYCTVIDFELPDAQELREEVVDYIVESREATVGEPVECSDELRDKLAHAMLGLTVEEAIQLLAELIAFSGQFSEAMLPQIADAKSVIFRKIEGLEYIPYRNIRDVSTVAGYDQYIKFIRRRSRAYSRHAQEAGIPTPRGCALIGTPGTGKTMIGQITARILGLDLVTMDIGSMYDSLVGASERRMRQALSIVSSLKNCVLMIDEIDKAFAGAHQNASTDSGVSSRLVSYFLKWLTERGKDDRTFVIVTMNRTDGIPPEMLRAGRFDRVFGVGLPSKEERIQHLRIQLQRYGVDPSHYNEKALATVATALDRFTGSEIEEIVISARHAAYDRELGKWEAAGKPGEPPSGESLWPTIDDLLAEVDTLPILAKLDSQEIATVEDFCRKRTVPVTSPQKPKRRAKKNVGNGVFTDVTASAN